MCDKNFRNFILSTCIDIIDGIGNLSRDQYIRTRTLCTCYSLHHFVPTLHVNSEVGVHKRMLVATVPQSRRRKMADFSEFWIIFVACLFTEDGTALAIPVLRLCPCLVFVAVAATRFEVESHNVFFRAFSLP